MLLPLLLGTAAYVPLTPRTVQPDHGLYPPEALAAKLEGDVPVSLHVDPSGALRCVAHGDLRLGTLRAASCRLVAARDVFAPGRARDGTATAVDIELVVRWRLDADETQFGGAVPTGCAFWVRRFDEPASQMNVMAGGRVGVAFDVTPDGRIERCTVAKTSYNLALDEEVCPLLVRRAILLPALGDDGRPRRTRATFTVQWSAGPRTRDATADAAGDGSTEAQ